MSYCKQNFTESHARLFKKISSQTDVTTTTTTTTVTATVTTTAALVFCLTVKFSRVTRGWAESLSDPEFVHKVLQNMKCQKIR